MARLFWLPCEAWTKIDPHLSHGKSGKPRVDDRRVLSGILHVLKVGCRWRDISPEYGPATKVYNRYNRWSQHGIWQRLFERLAASDDVPAKLMLDSTHLKAHRSANGAKGGVDTSDWHLPLPEAVNSPKRVIGNRAFNADRLRRWLMEWRITAVIPSTTTRTTPYPLN